MVQRLLGSLLVASALVGCGGETGSEPPLEDTGATEVDPGETGADATPDAAKDAPGDAPADTPTDAPPPPPSGPTRYPFGPLQSPMSAAVIARAKKAIEGAPTHRPDVFAKVGDSITVNTNFLNCFAGTDVKLDKYAALEPTRAFFAKTKVGSVTSFNRATLAAGVGWSAAKTISGTPSFVEQEVAAIQPTFAVLMLGTNDTYATGVDPFERNLRKNVDLLLAMKVLPIVSTIPQRADKPDAAALVPEMNAVIRAVAQARQIPLVDFFEALEPLAPGFGLAGDGIHPQVYVSAGAHGCWLTKEGLTEGFNGRNLVTLDALDRVKRFVLETAAPEPAPPALAGDGTWATPYVVDSIPFVDDRDTSKVKTRVEKVYACSSADESGPEVVYTLTLAKPQKLRVHVFDDDGVDVDVHWLTGATGATCTQRDDKLLDVDAPAGTFRIVVDTFAAAGVEKSGAYRITITPR